MNSQGTPLDEAFAAAGGGASIGAFVGVNSIVPLQVGLAIEALAGCQQRPS